MEDNNDILSRLAKKAKSYKDETKEDSTQNVSVLSRLQESLKKKTSQNR